MESEKRHLRGLIRGLIVRSRDIISPQSYCKRDKIQMLSERPNLPLYKAPQGNHIQIITITKKYTIQRFPQYSNRL